MRNDMKEPNQPSRDGASQQPSSLGAASQLRSLKAARMAKEGGMQGEVEGSCAPERDSAARVVHKRIDLEREQWQKPKASGIVAAVATSVVGIAVLVVVALAFGGVQG